MGTSAIPSLDAGALATPGAEADADTHATLRRAGEAGAIMLHDTVISPAFVRGVLTQYRHFFALPTPVKRRVAVAKPGAAGWSAVQAAQSGEVFDTTLDVGEGTAATAVRQWPQDMPEFRDTLSAYGEAASGVALRLLQAVAAADVEIPPNVKTRLRGHWQPPRSSGVAEGPEAPEPTFLTLLAGDGQAGIELRGRAGWLPVTLPPGTFFAIFGEELRSFSQGRIRAARWRLVPGPEPRLAVALVCGTLAPARTMPPSQPRATERVR